MYRNESDQVTFTQMLYHFKIELSDIDRNLYTSLDFRVAQHPSETAPYLLTRTLAYLLSYQEGLEFSPQGLGNPDDPALRALGQYGAVALWIEVGNPSLRKLHKASKVAGRVVVYTYKNEELLRKEIQTGDVHRASEIEIHAFDGKFLESLEKVLQKNNRWSVLHQQGQLDIETGGQSVSGEVKHLRLSSPDPV